MEIDMSERLLALRKKMGYSQEKVSELLGVTRQAISKWENSQGLPDLNNLLELSRLYNVSADYLLTGKIEQSKEPLSAIEPEKLRISPSKKLLLFLLGFAGVSVIAALFIFLLTLLTKSFFGG